MPQHQRLSARGRHHLAGDKSPLSDQLRSYWQRQEVENLRVERSADASVGAIRPHLDAACRIAKRGERGNVNNSAIEFCAAAHRLGWPCCPVLSKGSGEEKTLSS